MRSVVTGEPRVRLAPGHRHHRAGRLGVTWIQSDQIPCPYRVGYNNSIVSERVESPEADADGTFAFTRSLSLSPVPSPRLDPAVQLFNSSAPRNNGWYQTIPATYVASQTVPVKKFLPVPLPVQKEQPIPRGIKKFPGILRNSLPFLPPSQRKRKGRERNAQPSHWLSQRDRETLRQLRFY